MATATRWTRKASGETAEALGKRQGRFAADRLLPPLILAPSLFALFVFVYGFIGATIWVSLSNWRSLKIDLSLRHPLFQTYQSLFTDRRFQTDLRNTLVFTTLFLITAVGSGLVLAILLDQKVFGRALFRNVFLFPYALSFITTGVAWRWIFNPETGVNLLFQYSGLNAALSQVGVGPLKPGWLTDPQILWQINGGLEKIFPAASGIHTKLGIPLALIPVTIAAAWQLSGFAMAMYLAGLGTISNELREAAQLDGASTWQIYRHVIIPLLTPITISVLIILGHVSLKIFDLIYAMSGKGPGFATDVPGIYVFDKTFAGTQYNLGAAASIVMLILVSLVIVPYLVRTLREL